MKLATAAQMRELDRRAIEEHKIPSIDLMERAAAEVAQAALDLLPDRPGRCRAAVFCGAGNNGGDGVGAARLLFLMGLKVRVFLVGDYQRLTPDAMEETGRLSECGVELEDFDPNDKSQAAWARSCQVVIDAVFGVGLSRDIAPESKYAAAVDLINACKGTVIAADVASGVEADTGRVLGRAVKADRTVTFSLAKVGQFAGDGALLRESHGPRHRHSRRPGPGDGVSCSDGGGGLRRRGPAAPEGRRPQGGLRQAADRGRGRGLHRRALSHRLGGGAVRLRAGVPGGAGLHLAGGGGQVRLRHALPPGELVGRDGPQEGPDRHPGKAGGLRRPGPGPRPGAARGDGQAGAGDPGPDGEARGPGRRRHKRAGGTYRYSGQPPGPGHHPDPPRRGVRPHRRGASWSSRATGPSPPGRRGTPW